MINYTFYRRRLGVRPFNAGHSPSIRYLRGGGIAVRVPYDGGGGAGAGLTSGRNIWGCSLLPLNLTWAATLINASCKTMPVNRSKKVYRFAWSPQCLGMPAAKVKSPKMPNPSIALWVTSTWHRVMLPTPFIGSAVPYWVHRSSDFSSWLSCTIKR